MKGVQFNSSADRGAYLFELMSGAEDKYIDEMLSDTAAADIKAANKRSRIRIHSAVAALAAVFVLVIGVSVIPDLGGLKSQDYAAENATIRADETDGGGNGALYNGQALSHAEAEDNADYFDTVGATDKEADAETEAVTDEEFTAMPENHFEAVNKDAYEDADETDQDALMQNDTAIGSAGGENGKESFGETARRLDLKNNLYCEGVTADGITMYCSDTEFESAVLEPLLKNADDMPLIAAPNTADTGVRYVDFICYLDTGGETRTDINITVYENGYMKMDIKGESLWFKNQNAAQIVEAFY